jgi:hypothetical protein
VLAWDSRLANGAGPYSIVIADFNRDGKLDLAIPAGSQSVAVLLGNGDGTFRAPIYTFDGNGVGLASADFNGDGKPDLAAIGASGIAILLGNGDGTFQTATFISTEFFDGKGNLWIRQPVTAAHADRSVVRVE